MKKLLSLYTLVFLSTLGNAQEINFEIVVNSDLVNQTNQQVFKTLETSINEFMINKTWTNQDRANEEQLDCSMVLNLTGYSGTQFEGTLQVQIQRPVYNTNFKTPILNHLDKDISFSYQEFQPLFYNTSTYESNLVSLLSFYAFISLGMEADTFQEKGGNPFYDVAQQIANLAGQNQKKGWNQADGKRNRYWLIETLQSNTFKEYRTDTKVEWRKKRWEASVRVLKRARREWEETVAQIVQSLERTFDPGASQGTYKRAAVDRSVKKHQTTDDRTHA